MLAKQILLRIVYKYSFEEKMFCCDSVLRSRYFRDSCEDSVIHNYSCEAGGRPIFLLSCKLQSATWTYGGFTRHRTDATWEKTFIDGHWALYINVNLSTLFSVLARFYVATQHVSCRAGTATLFFSVAMHA